jgi:hypothetical protein
MVVIGFLSHDQSTIGKTFSKVLPFVHDGGAKGIRTIILQVHNSFKGSSYRTILPILKDSNLHRCFIAHVMPEATALPG